ncbi:mRNA-binding phosphate metabolism regulator [Maudiozyma humilis]|uniref:mRNA-binding phosphate metabolism regulator n=1 Tax=Maudiozyma humilis TaxID=51915 RepID=A0AAV5S4I5_MAUHU|nr:mRNA-binding phosphate metabolism regulator [Kazachstania humilis]
MSPEYPNIQRPRIRYNKNASNYIDIPPNSSFFVIKSYSLQHVQRAYEHNIWSSTHSGNKKLSAAYNACRDGSKIFLFFSVNGSGRFCGVTEMVSDVSKDLDTSIWDNNSKYGSAFKIKWLCVRDIDNRMMRHLIVPDNQNKPVTNSRDTQLLPKEVGISMLNIFQSKHFKTSTFLDPEDPDENG